MEELKKEDKEIPLEEAPEEKLEFCHEIVDLNYSYTEDEIMI
jgi:hypothetical protein